MDKRRWLQKTARRCRRRAYDTALWLRAFRRRLARPGLTASYRPRHLGRNAGNAGDSGDIQAARLPLEARGVISGLVFPGAPGSRLTTASRRRALRRATTYYAFLAVLAVTLLAYRVNPELPNSAGAAARAWLHELAAGSINPTASDQATLAGNAGETDISARSGLTARGLLSRTIPQMSRNLGIAPEGVPSPREEAAGLLERVIFVATGVRFSRPDTLLMAEIGNWPRWRRSSQDPDFPQQEASGQPLSGDAAPAPPSPTGDTMTVDSGAPTTVSAEKTRAAGDNQAPAGAPALRVGDVTPVHTVEEGKASAGKTSPGSASPGVPSTHAADADKPKVSGAPNGVSSQPQPANARLANSALPASVSAVSGLGRETAARLRGVDFGTRPLVFIYHTHSSEAYHGRMDQHDKSLDYSPNVKTGVVGIGDIVASVLQDRYRIPVAHSRLFHDLEDMSGAYGRSKVTLLNALKSYPALAITIDVHRDGVPTKESPPESLLVHKVNGSSVARVQILAGKGVPGRRFNPNWRQNLSLAQTLNEKLESLYPGLSRGVVVREDWPYNMDLFAGALLIEVGDHYNTLEEAQRAAVLVADAVAATLGELSERRAPPMLRKRL